MNLFAGKQWRDRQRTDLWTWERGGEDVEGGMNGGSSRETYTLTCKTDITNGNLLYDSRNSKRGSVTI